MQDREQKLQNLVNRLEGLIHNISSQEELKIQVIMDVLNKEWSEKTGGISLSLAECHTIDCIGRNEMFNSTAIAKHLNITKGGISKITAKLVKKNMIETYQTETNRKEIYFRLKPFGQKVFEIHEKLHKEAVNSIKDALSSYSSDELELVSGFLKEITAAIMTGKGLKET